jgi:hypothetical protein
MLSFNKHNTITTIIPVEYTIKVVGKPLHETSIWSSLDSTMRDSISPEVFGMAVFDINVIQTQSSHFFIFGNCRRQTVDNHTLCFSVVRNCKFRNTKVGNMKHCWGHFTFKLYSYC